MGIMVRERAAQEAGLMEPRRGDYLSCGALQAERQLPCGWEKCLDLKSGLIYFKDWNSGTLTYKDPRQQAVVPLATQRIGLLSISLSPDLCNASSEGASRELKRVKPPQRFLLAQTATTTDGESSATETTTTTATTNSDDEHSLELSLNLPGTTSRVFLPATNSSQEESVCTMEKVRRALERSNWWTSGSRKRSSHNTTLPTALSLLSSRPSTSSRESNSSRLEYSGARDFTTSPSTSSQCSESPSAMSYEGDDEEVQQRPRRTTPAKPLPTRDAAAAAPASSSSALSRPEVMVTVGCKSCLLYVMLSKAHPCCPKCGNTDVLLQLPAPPLPKKQRLDAISSPTWSWCAA